MGKRNKRERERKRKRERRRLKRFPMDLMALLYSPSLTPKANGVMVPMLDTFSRNTNRLKIIINHRTGRKTKGKTVGIANGSRTRTNPRNKTRRKARNSNKMRRNRVKIAPPKGNRAKKLVLN